MRKRLELTSLLSAHPEPCFSFFSVTLQRELLAEFSGSRLLFGTTQDGREIVLKQSVYSQGLQREWLGLALALQLGSSVQKPVAIVETNDDKPEFFLMTEWVKGEPLTQYYEDSRHRDLGKLIKNLHRTVQIEGKEWQESHKSGFEYYDRFLNYWLQHRVPQLEPESLPVSLQKVLSLPTIDHLAEVTPAFSHQDIHDEQVLVDDRSLTLIDFELWQEDDPLVDLAMYLFHALRQSQPISRVKEVFSGYTDNQNFTARQQEVIAFYTLFIAARAVVRFRQLNSPYIAIAEHNLDVTSRFINQEQLWKQL